MKIEDAICIQNTDLYESIRKKYKPIIFIQDPEYKSWASVVGVNDDLTIYYNKTDWKQAALTHELLHADIQHKGYKEINFIKYKDDKINKIIERLVRACNNEFQHIKMFKLFIDMGFKSNEFYCDDDIYTEDKLIDELNKSTNDCISLATHLLSISAPGGYLSLEARKKLFNVVDAYNNGKYKSTIKKLRSILLKWEKCEEYDAQKYIIEYLKIAGVDYVQVSFKKGKKHFIKNRF